MPTRLLGLIFQKRLLHKFPNDAVWSAQTEKHVAPGVLSFLEVLSCRVLNYFVNPLCTAATRPVPVWRQERRAFGVQSRRVVAALPCCRRATLTGRSSGSVQLASILRTSSMHGIDIVVYIRST